MTHPDRLEFTLEVVLLNAYTRNAVPQMCQEITVRPHPYWNFPSEQQVFQTSKNNGFSFLFAYVLSMLLPIVHRERTPRTASAVQGEPLSLVQTLG